MLRLTANQRLRLMVVHGYTLVGLGLALFYIRSTMTNLLFSVFGGALALLLVTASLLLIAGVDWLCAAGLGRQQSNGLKGALMVSTTVAGACVFLAVYPGTTFRMLADVFAVYALSLTAGKFGLARSWPGNVREKTTIYVMAAIGLGFAVLLFAVARRNDRTCLAAVAAYSLFIGTQMLLSMYFLQKQLTRAIEPADGNEKTPLTAFR